MSENKIDAMMDQVKGSAKEIFRKITGDKKVESEGVTEKIAGKAKEVAADAKDVVDGVVDGVKKSLGNKR